MTVELELAVVRGREYLARAVFRPDAVVSLGSAPRATVRLPEPELPEHHDLLKLTSRGARIRFERSTLVELQLDGAMLDTAQLVSSGRAWETAQGWEADLPPGAKGVVHYGGLRVLLKLQEARQVTIWAAADDAGAVCGGCSAPLPWAVAGRGALTPCRVCGDLNRVADRDRQFEIGATALVPSMPAHGADPGAVTHAPDAPIPAELPPLYGPTKPMPVQVAAAVSRIDGGADLPTFDAIQAKKGAYLPTFDAIQAKKGADLPTFDAIQTRRSGELPTHDAIGSQRIAESRAAARGAGRAAAVLDPDAERTVPPGTPTPAETPPPTGSLFGTNLPTFDAISVIKQDQTLSTQAAMTAMKREPAARPGLRRLGPASPPSAPAPPAAHVQPTGAVPARQVTAEHGAAGGTGAPFSGLQLQPTGTVPVARDTGEVVAASFREPVRLGSEPTPVLIPCSATDEAWSLLDAWDADGFDAPSPSPPAPARAQDPRVLAATEVAVGAQTEPGRRSPQVAAAPPRPEAPRAAPPPPSAPRAAPPPPSAPRVAPPPPSSDGLRLPPSRAGGPPTAPRALEDDEDYDDFLMGRDDGGIGTKDRTGWLLIGFGLISGLVGVGLILYVLSQ
jgi:hypothetical protein